MNLFNIVSSYDEAWKAVILPGRQEYNLFDLGPPEFVVKDNKVRRTDFRLLNKRGHVLECSFFQHAQIEEPLPCVIYLHANGCCRLEALQYVDLVLANQASLFCFDFSGSGKSEGTYSSVGWFEQDDLECILQYVLNTGRVSKVAVWGRSMGAITTLLYAEKDPRISCVILDSPFASFKRLVKEVAKQKAFIPEFLASGAFSMIRKTIMKKANFDIDDLKPIKHADKIKIPALFGTAKDDTFVVPQHSKDLYAKYAGPKELMIFEGDHNSQRPPNWLLSVRRFLKTYLLDEDGTPTTSRSGLKLSEPFRSAPESLADITDTTKSKQYQRAPKKTLTINHQQQKSMSFTWLEHSASTPHFIPAAEVLKDEKQQEPPRKEAINIENLTSQPTHSKLKLRENKGTGNPTRAINIPIYPYQGSQYTIDQKASHKTTRPHENRRNGIPYSNVQEPSKPLRQLLKGNLENINTYSQSQLPGYHTSLPHNQNLNPNPQNVGISTSGLPLNKLKSDYNVHHAASQIDLRRVDVSLKDKSVSSPTPNMNNYSITDSQRNISSPFTIENNQQKIQKGQNVPGPGIAVHNVYIPQPKAQQGGDTPNLTQTSQVQSFSEALKDQLKDLSTGRNIPINITPSTSVSHNISAKSFISALDNNKPVQAKAVLESQKKRPIMFQVNLNTKVPFINPTTKSYHSNTALRDERRSSESLANLLKQLIPVGAMEKEVPGFRASAESRGVYINDKKASH